MLSGPPEGFPEPDVELINAFAQPFNNSVAAARTCYSSKVVYPADVDKDEKARALRDSIAESIYEAGHHTTIQHPTFQFVLKRVSRQFLWSFLHSHPFYNSEQVSQRYVEVKRGNYVVPPMPEPARARFEAVAELQMDGYKKLQELIEPDVTKEYFRIYPGRRREPEKWKNGIKKKVIEVARYVLPVATHAHLFHTVSGLTLHRYHRLCRQYDTPVETRLVVDRMIAAVNRMDPLFFRRIEDEIPLEETLEHRMLETCRGPEKVGSAAAFVAEFDRDLGPWHSKLADYKANAEATMARSVRTVLGATADRLSDADAIEAVMNPSINRYLGGSLNVLTLSKLARAMNHPHFTFRKKLSHTADSQDQRHRMTPGTRPILAAHFVPEKPDYIVPVVVEKSPAAREEYDRILRETWKGIGDLLSAGVSAEYALYLLPNAFPIRFEESGDLMHLHHKWTTRLCYLAQEEIWRACREETLQVAEVHPRLGRHITAPCGLRKTAGATPFCPEGNRYCGVPVWSKPVSEYARVI